MEIIAKATKDLIPYKNNPRNNDDAVDYVAESIKQFGFKVPIIIDKDNVIIAGHTRLKAAEKLNIEKVPCIIADDLTEEQVKAFRIADNKVGEYASWDNKLLAIELQDLEKCDFDLELTGFEGWEIENILNPITDDDLEDFFEEKQTKEKEPKKIVCPHCGEEFEV